MRRARALALVVLAACAAKGPTATPLHATTAPATPTPAPPVAPTPTPTGAVVELAQLHGPIRALAVLGGDPSERPRIESIFHDLVGQPLDRRKLRAALELALQPRTLVDVVARGVQLEGGVRLELQLTSQPLVGAITVREAGGAALPVPAELAARPGLPLFPPLVDVAVGKLVQRYQETGHLHATGGWRGVPASGGKVDVAIKLTPGPQATFGPTVLVGNHAVPTATLLPLVASTLTRGGPWVTAYVTHAQLVLLDGYYDRGYVNAEVRDGPPPAAGEGPVTFQITEGPRFVLGKLTVTGVPPAEAKALATYLQLKPGEVFVRSKIMAAIERVRLTAEAAGETRVSVAPLTKVDVAKKTIDLELQVTPGS